MITYLGKLGELTLKGSNLHTFEKLLLKNTRDCANGCPYIAPNEDCLVDCSSLYD
jgi:adenylyl- and sulfurtransferase ThiI